MDAVKPGHIALIGMSGRFPGSADLDAFWDGLAAGREAISTFAIEELRAAREPILFVDDPHYVPAKGVVASALEFDAAAFDFSARDAALADPQFRVLLELAQEALEDAGYAGDRGTRIGIFAGSGPNSYQEYLRRQPELMTSGVVLHAMLLNQVDFLAAWVAYSLDLTGPCITVQAACSTSLAAVHYASQSLQMGECDVALAGGISLSFPQRSGYVHVPGGMYSADGHCRAFDSKADGFVPSDGGGLVVLRRLEDAIVSGDRIRSVIKGTALTNDGAAKIGFTAPNQQAMIAAISESLAIADVPAETIRLVEAHGAATPLGDPMEVAALTHVFRRSTPKRQFCALGSVKSNIGHTNAAAGAAALIKTVLAIEHAVIPPSLHCDEPSRVINFEKTPFYVAGRAEPWAADGGPRRACVNSFGIGGTNVNVVVEEPPSRKRSGPARADQVLILSAASDPALGRVSEQLADALARTPDLPLADVAFTLAVGRRTLRHRRAIVASSNAEAIEALRHRAGDRHRHEPRHDECRVFVVCTGAPVAIDLVDRVNDAEPSCRLDFDRHARDVWRALARRTDAAADDPARTRVATVAFEYALGKRLAAAGVTVDGIVGLGAGELSAAALAGLVAPADAIAMARAGINMPDWPGARASQPTTMECLFPERGRWLARGETVELRSMFGGAPGDRQAAQKLARISSDPAQVFVVLGGGDAGASMLRGGAAEIVPVFGAGADAAAAARAIPDTIARLWLAGVAIDWRRYYADERRHRVRIPTYPFERTRFFAAELSPAHAEEVAPAKVARERTDAAAPDDASLTDLQAVVASVWAFHLRVDRVGLHDSFFELGGNSISATKVVATLRETLQIDLPLRAILEEPTVAKLCEALEASAREWHIDIDAIAHAVRAIRSTDRVADDAADAVTVGALGDVNART